MTDRSVARLGAAASLALSGAVVVYTVAGVAGYACFGEACECMALNNYARRDDVAATAARLAVGVSLLASFPLRVNGPLTRAEPRAQATKALEATRVCHGG